MTTPRPPAGGVPVRLLTAWALVALAGTIILFGFLAWIFPPSRTDFLDRFGVDSFTNLIVLGAPVLAVLIATKVGPALPRARLIGLLALIEYAVALLLGALAFLITLASQFEGLDSGIYAFGGVLQAIGNILVDLLELSLLALAALWTYRIFTVIGGTLPRLTVDTD
jgi:hypothetical protein